MIELFLISIAAICKALSDTLAHHFDTSVFRDFNRNTWDVSYPNKIVPKVFNYPVDAWHIFNSIQLTCWLVLPLVYRHHFKWWVDFGVAGFLFIIVFNIFYNKIFR